MAWRRVVKRIKGSHYIYEQRSYRHLGKVKTESRYIGRANLADSFIYGLKHPYGVTPFKLPDDKRNLRFEYEGNGQPVGKEITPPAKTPGQINAERIEKVKSEINSLMESLKDNIPEGEALSQKSAG